MWDGFAYYPLRKDYLEPYYEGPTKVFDSRVEEGTASTSAPRSSTPTART